MYTSMSYSRVILPMLVLALPLAQQLLGSAVHRIRPEPKGEKCLLILRPNCAKHVVGSLHPHEESCSYFYRCNENQEAVGYMCPQGQSFLGLDGHICVPSDYVVCNNCPPRMRSAPSPTADACLAACPDAQQCSYAGEWLPYPPDCTKYIYCNNNLAPVVTNCWNSTHFSPQALECMDPTLANCPLCEPGF